MPELSPFVNQLSSIVEFNLSTMVSILPLAAVLFCVGVIGCWLDRWT